MEERLCHFHKISAISRSREATREVTFIFTRWDQTVFLLGQGDLVVLVQHGRGERWREVSCTSARASIKETFSTGQTSLLSSTAFSAFRVRDTTVKSSPERDFLLFSLMKYLPLLFLFLGKKSLSFTRVCTNTSYLFLLYIYIYYLFKVFSIIMLYKHYCDARSTSRWWRKNLFNTFK